MNTDYPRVIHDRGGALARHAGLGRRRLQSRPAWLRTSAWGPGGVLGLSIPLAPLGPALVQAW
jgi:hypothetical protein